MDLVTMLDATAAHAANIPAGTKKIGGYTTGNGIAWSAPLWELFPLAGKVRIEQDPPGALALHSDELDVERGAAQPQHVPAWVDSRLAAGIRWSTIYGSDDYLAASVQALHAAGMAKYLGHVDAHLANWNLSEQEAAAIVGTLRYGLTVRAVQWASPTSNPHMAVPGGTLTLAEALVDVSVAQASWHPAPVPPPVRPSRLWALELPADPAADAPGWLQLVSADGGHTYR